MSNMDISVIIPTYKRPALLLECLRCLEHQVISSQQFEVIIVSDGYDEVTAAAVSNYQQNSRLMITCLHTDGKKGPAAARNLGWQHAHASLIAFTDDDCQPTPYWLSSILEAYKGEELIVYSGFTQVPVPRKPTDFALNTFHLQTASFITANCACTKQALIKTGGFDERFKAAWREDSDLEFKFLTFHIPIVKIKEAVIIHPVRTGVPWGVSIKEQKKGLYDALLYKKYPDLYRSRIQGQPLWNYYGMIVLTLTLIVAIIKQDYRWALFSGVVLLFLLLFFFVKRIMPASKSPKHITEMLFTSMVIPFVSVYWRLYGAVKYRVFFI
jgi:glycosyltransferase involved in cell wall biosynthesis